MIARLVGSGLVLASLAGAPFQCGGSQPDAPAETSAGDALYDLAMDFRAKGNEQAARETLRYLVAHFSSNRHVPAARAELAESGAAPAAPSTEK